MGVDIYMNWRDITKEDVEAQFQALDGDAPPPPGKVGYLRETYGTAPYATHVLLPELFLPLHPSPFPWIVLPAVTLRGRLPLAILAALVGESVGCRDADAAAALVELGIEPRSAKARLRWGIHDDGMDFVGDAFHGTRAELRKRDFGIVDFDKMSEGAPEVLRDPEVQERLANVCDSVRSIIDFVELAETREAETGEPVWIESR